MLSILVAVLLVATAGLHSQTMAAGSLQRQVLGNQQPGCGTTTCPKNVEVFGLIATSPKLDVCGRELLAPSPSPFSLWILPIPHVGRAPPSVRV